MNDGLTPAEKSQVLERLRVFKNGFIAEAAEAVCADDALPADKLRLAVEALAADGLLVQAQLPSGAVRYSHSEPQTSEPQDSRRFNQLKAEWFTRYLQDLRPALGGPEQEMWLDQIELDKEDIHAAIEANLGDNAPADLALRLSVACFRFWYVRGHYEVGYEFTLRAVNRVPMRQDHLKLRALNNAGLLIEPLGKFSDRAAAAYRSTLTLAQAIGDKAAEAATRGNLATVLRDRGQAEEATQQLLEATRILRTLDEPPKLLAALINLSGIKLETGDYSDLPSLFDEAQGLGEQLGEKYLLAYIEFNRGEFATSQSDLGVAEMHYRKSIQSFHNMGDLRGIAMVLKAWGGVATAKHAYSRAASLLGGAEAVRSACKVQLPPVEVNSAVVTINDVREALGEEAFHQEYEKGRSFSLAEIVRFAVTN